MQLHWWYIHIAHIAYTDRTVWACFHDFTVILYCADSFHWGDHQTWKKVQPHTWFFGSSAQPLPFLLLSHSCKRQTTLISQPPCHKDSDGDGVLTIEEVTWKLRWVGSRSIKLWEAYRFMWNPALISKSYRIQFPCSRGSTQDQTRNIWHHKAS